ncbi:MAG: PEP-CTERM sorting domain-containing protein [Gemmatimonadaceae bacterium]|nr:PEP-CTERM sorting domain-containing protein [Gemmatimonadaceae bacterium]
MTISFTASTQSIVATNARDTDYVMGTLTKTFTGAPFTLPRSAAPAGPLFSFELLLSSSAPRVTSGRMLFSYTGLTETSLPFDCCDQSDYTVLQLDPPPAPLTYGAVVYNTFRGVNIAFDTRPQTITARVGIVPEPQTYVLMATGFMLLAVIARRRRSA